MYLYVWMNVLYYDLYERDLMYILFIRENFMLYILMYPVLILTHVPDFLDTSGMGVTVRQLLPYYYTIKLVNKLGL